MQQLHALLLKGSLLEAWTKKKKQSYRKSQTWSSSNFVYLKERFIIHLCFLGKMFKVKILNRQTKYKYCSINIIIDFEARALMRCFFFVGGFSGSGRSAPSAEKCNLATRVPPRCLRHWGPYAARAIQWHCSPAQCGYPPHTTPLCILYCARYSTGTFAPLCVHYPLSVEWPRDLARLSLFLFVRVCLVLLKLWNCFFLCMSCCLYHAWLSAFVLLTNPCPSFSQL